MTIVYSLTPSLRKKLKHPLGTLIRGSFAETMDRLKEMVEKEKPSCIISVGDTVSKNMVRKGFTSKLVIVDNITMRKATQPVAFTAEKTVYVQNPAATITDAAINAIQEAFRHNGTTKIIVDGEEDLLTLAVVLYAPNDSVVIYGQPYEGIVVVRASASKKEEIATILKTMENPRKAK